MPDVERRTAPRTDWHSSAHRCYGLRGDGSDERARLQAWINDIPAGGIGVLARPWGNNTGYKFGGAGLTIPQSCTILYGKPNGWAFSNRLEYTGSGTAITLGADDIRLAGFDLLGISAAIGIDAGLTNNTIFERLNILRFTASGIKSSGFRHKYRDCLFQGPSAGGGVAIHAQKAWSACAVENCAFSWGGGYTFTGIDVGDLASTSSTGNRIVGCSFEGAPAGATCMRFRAGTHGMSVRDCRGELAGGLYIQQDDNAQSLVIDGGTVTGNTSTTLISLSGRGIIVSGLALGNATNGIVFNATAARGLVGPIENLGSVTNLIVDNTGGATIKNYTAI